MLTTDTGSSYLTRDRTYSTTSGRWTATDPITAAMTRPFDTIYSYVGNQPTLFIDPLGDHAVPVAGTIVATGPIPGSHRVLQTRECDGAWGYGNRTSGASTADVNHIIDLLVHSGEMHSVDVTQQATNIAQQFFGHGPLSRDLARGKHEGDVIANMVFPADDLAQCAGGSKLACGLGVAGVIPIPIGKAGEVLRIAREIKRTKAAERLAAESAGTVFRADASHIFRDATGHLAQDTALNRGVIQGVVNPGNLRSTITLPDGSTLAKYYETLPDGTQAWAEVRNGTEITNGGLNATPR